MIKSVAILTILPTVFAVSGQFFGANVPSRAMWNGHKPGNSAISVAAAAVAQPKPKAEKVVISKEALTLTVYGENDLIIAEYPVAAGINYGNKVKEGDKKTPEGIFKVQQIQDASFWTHDFKDGKGEIKGAYGSHFIRLLTPPHRGIGIHGTHDPASIGSRATEGCIRLRNEDLLKFAELVYVGLPVTITSSEKDHTADSL